MANADPATIEQARRWARRWATVEDEILARGMLRTVLEKDLKAILVTFRKLTPSEVPFLGRNLDEQIDEVYRVIGELTGEDLRSVRGLGDHIGKIVSDDRRNQLGALLDLRVADDVGLAGAVGDPDGGFEILMTGVGSLKPDEVVSRDMDIFDPLTGFAHESKNWPSGLPRLPNGEINQEALNKFMEEFRRDIIIHGAAGQNFSRYRLNFRSATIPHLEQIKMMLDDQFTSAFVQARLRPDEIQDIKNDFDRLWKSGTSGTLLRFYP